MVLAGALGYGCFWEALQRPLCLVNGARKFVWHFDFGRVVLAVSGCCTWVWYFWEALQRSLCRGNGARKFVWHFDFGRVVLAAALGYGCFWEALQRPLSAE